MNIKTLQWDNEILESTKIPAAMLPTILSSSEVYGQVATIELKEIKDVPISGQSLTQCICISLTQ